MGKQPGPARPRSIGTGRRRRFNTRSQPLQATSAARANWTLKLSGMYSSCVGDIFAVTCRNWPAAIGTRVAMQSVADTSRADARQRLAP